MMYFCILVKYFEHFLPVSNPLLKYIEYLTDVKGKEISLNYLKTKEGKEVDFVIVEDEEVRYLLEIKLSDNKVSPQLLFFANLFPGAKAFQLVNNLRQEEHVRGIASNSRIPSSTSRRIHKRSRNFIKKVSDYLKPEEKEKVQCKKK
jgi:hypothetical protein